MELETSSVIQVEMHVSRYQTYPEDGGVQVWGHVGDYEVSVCLPIDDPRVRRLMGKAPATVVAKRRTRRGS